MVTIVLLLIGLFLYFLPTIGAVMEKKKNATAIFAVNLFFGWTLIGWVVALVWALTKEDKKETTPVQTKSDADELKKLADLKEKGVISEDEFNAKKKQVLGTSK